MHRFIKISDINPNPFQPRSVMSKIALQELVSSIRKYGVLQPLLVREDGDGKYELIAGHRRLEGAKIANLDEVPAIIRNVTNSEMLELAIIENLHREDMSAIDKAEGFRRLMTEFSFTQNQIGQLLGISRPAVANTLRLLELPEVIREALHCKKISEGHARALLLIKDAKMREVALKRIVDKGLSVRETEEFSKRVEKHSDMESGVAGVDRSVLEFIERLQERLGTKVVLHKSGEGGTIEIEFYDEEDLHRIADAL